MPRFDVILSYDLGNGLRIEKGAEMFSQWPAFKEQPRTAPRAARRGGNAHALLPLQRESRPAGQAVGARRLLGPLGAPGRSGAARLGQLRAERAGAAHARMGRRAAAGRVAAGDLPDRRNPQRPAPAAGQQPARGEHQDSAAPARAICSRHSGGWPREYPVALAEFAGEKIAGLAAPLAGATLSSVENLLRLKEYRREPIRPDDVSALKKTLVEREANDLIEFIESRRTLDDIHAQDKLKTALREDIALWRQGDLAALPMGYLICGPVGTGKTFLVECLAGEAGIPVVKIKNFRDRWVGTTEGNLEKIFRLLQGLGRCFVFIDEADQALGKRDGGGNDAGLSGRIYSMFAKIMSDTANRGRILWVLASSRPDLIEVDLKRPGRVDVKIPIFPTTTPEEGFALIRALCQRRGVASGRRNLLPPVSTSRTG